MTCNTGKFRWSDATPTWQSVWSLSLTAGYFESSLCWAGVSRLFAFSSPKDRVSEVARCLEECLTMCALNACGCDWSWWLKKKKRVNKNIREVKLFLVSELEAQSCVIIPRQVYPPLCFSIIQIIWFIFSTLTSQLEINLFCEQKGSLAKRLQVWHLASGSELCYN